MRARDALGVGAVLLSTCVAGCRSQPSSGAAEASPAGSVQIGPDAVGVPKGEGTPAPGATSQAAAAPSGAAPAAPSGASSAAASGAGARSPGCPDFAAAFARGRKAAAEKRFEEAIGAFDDAVRARPVDARARAERGYVRFLEGEPWAALRDFVDALRLTRDAALLGQVWFNVGLVFQKLGDAERERVAFAAAAKHGSGAAKAKLGARSTCPALWKKLDAGPKGAIAKGWKELADARMTVCTLPEPPRGATEAERARHMACRGCGYGGSDEGDQCSGPGPWAISSGYMHFHTHSFFVYPLGGDRYWYLNEADVITPPELRVKSGYMVTEDPVAEETDVFRSMPGSDLVEGGFSGRYGGDAFVTNRGAWSDEVNVDGTPVGDGGSGCKPDITAEVDLEAVNGAQMGGTSAMPRLARKATTLYSLATGRAVFSVVSYAGDVSVAIEPGRVKLAGEGCDETVAIGK